MITHSPETLLVEDNPYDAELVIRTLQRSCLANHLVHVSDGQSALDFLFGTGLYEGRNVQEQPKVVFLDLKLPKLDGLEVLRQIRADKRTQLVPVVILTSSREDCDIVASYQLGANSYIVKPVDFDAFTETVTKTVWYWLKTNVAHHS
jgi:CheY-like chemotaxis protein